MPKAPSVSQSRRRGHRGVELKWWIIVLVYYYGLRVGYCADLFEVNVRSVQRWHKRFQDTGRVSRKERTPRPCWPQYVLDVVKDKLVENPGIYIDELQAHIIASFPEVRNVSHSTILRMLHMQLGFTRKVMVKRAYEAREQDIERYVEELQYWYMYPEQLIFIDETSKDARSVYRARGWGKTGAPVFATQAFDRGQRASVLAALDVHGFIRWHMTSGTYSRDTFHDAFVQRILPELHQWPGPRSIVVIDNASIHRYPQLAQACELVKAKLVYLPPYTPQLNPIECGFNLMKAWLQRNIDSELWKLDPMGCIDTAMVCSTSYENVGLAMLAYCGYEVGGVLLRLVDRRMKRRVTTRFPWMRGLHSVRDYTAGTNLRVQLDDPLDDPDEEESSASDDGSSSDGAGDA